MYLKEVDEQETQCIHDHYTIEPADVIEISDACVESDSETNYSLDWQYSLININHTHDIEEISDANEGIKVFELQDDKCDELEGVVIDGDSEVHTFEDEYANEIHYVDQYQKDPHADFDEEILLSLNDLFDERSSMHVQEDSKDELDLLFSSEVVTPNIGNKDVHELSQLFEQPCVLLMNHASNVYHSGCYNEYGCVSIKRHDGHVLVHNKCF